MKRQVMLLAATKQVNRAGHSLRERRTFPTLKSISRMKYAIAILLALMGSLVCADSPLETKHKREVITVDFLLEACSVVGETARGQVPHFDCESYIYGVVDSHLAVRASLKKSDQACFPSSIAPWQVYEKLYKVPLNQRQGVAAPFIIGVLARAFPCR